RRGEHAVVDAEVVELAAEVLAVDSVAADPERVAVDLEGAGGGKVGHHHAVDVQAKPGAVVGAGHVRPGVQGKQVRPAHEPAADAGDGTAEGRHAARRAASGSREVDGVDLLLHDGPPGRGGGQRIDPGLEGGGGGEVQGGGVGHADEVIHAVEQEG